jgi:hypothetical protein
VELGGGGEEKAVRPGEASLNDAKATSREQVSKVIVNRGDANWSKGDLAEEAETKDLP